MSDSLVSSKGQYDCQDATVAQLVAQRIRNAWVAGSSPASGLTEKTLCPQGFFFLFARHGRALTGESPEHA